MVIFLTPDYRYLRSINGEDLKSSLGHLNLTNILPSFMHVKVHDSAPIKIKVKISKHLFSASFESFPTLF